jgi:hypothetical protein
MEIKNFIKQNKFKFILSIFITLFTLVVRIFAELKMSYLIDCMFSNTVISDYSTYSLFPNVCRNLSLSDLLKEYIINFILIPVLIFIFIFYLEKLIIKFRK